MTRAMLNRNGWGLDPLNEFRRFRDEMNALLEGRPSWPRWLGQREYPAVNVWSSDNEAVLTAEIPGVDANDLDISVQGDTVTLRGEREPEELKDGEAYHRQERGAGQFVRTVQLPFEVQADKVAAQLTNGVLQLSLPRAEATKPKRIAVTSG